VPAFGVYGVRIIVKVASHPVEINIY
jgi:hypothetical protein